MPLQITGFKPPMRPFTSILVDPNVDNRAFFKTAVRALPDFGEIYSCGQTNEVLPKIESSQKPWDIVFISYRIPLDEIKRFLDNFRASPIGKETAVVQIFKMGEASGEKIDATIALGFNGILCEPYSGDGLKDCAKQSVKLRLNGTKNKIGITLKNLIPAVAKEVANNGGKMDKLLNSEHKELSDSCKGLRELAAFAGSNYDSIINEVFDNLKKRVKDEYAGVSARLKSRFAMEGTVQDSLRQELRELR